MRHTIKTVALVAALLGGGAALATPEGPVDASGHPTAYRRAVAVLVEAADAAAAATAPSDTAGAEDWVANYIRAFAALAPEYKPNQRVIERAPALAQLIVAAAREADVDYRIPTVIIRLETGFREGEITGKVDHRDHGLMQVNGGTATTPEGQLREGLAVWTNARGRCGSLERTLTAYAMGRCNYPTTTDGMSDEEWKRAAFKIRGVAYRLRLLAAAGLTTNAPFSVTVPAATASR
jgi:hypothetical protein